MGKRILLLLLGLSLLLGFLQALRCYRCFHVRPDGSCEFQRTICDAGENEECLLVKYYLGNKIIRGYQNFRHSCTNRTISLGRFQVVNSCCKDKDLCNRMWNLGT
ncbi:prostate and testis expressed protein 14-like [Loxodonta africana]|uniref:prostate and testis expressed protein 14-like n=1 Tax=Loxodonta africana TaxID=9785 RepID=UPI0030CFE58D